MKPEGTIFAIATAFFGVLAIVYWFVSYEPMGTVTLAFTAGLAFLISFYIYFTGRRLAGPRPEDREDADVEEGAGEVGFFSPHSWWPLPLAASSSILVLGLIFAWWLFAVGTVLLLLSVVGFVFEYYRAGAQTP